MSYKMPKLTDKRKLCPRCGAPMMEKTESVKFCPVCQFTESTKRTEIVIKEEEKKVEKIPQIEIYRVTASGITKETSLESQNAYVVVDRKSNTLWIWKGSKCSPGDAYKAGVQTIQLKSTLKVYSSTIKTVDEGDEPESFPVIGEELKVLEDQKQREEVEQKKHKELELKKRKVEEEQKLRGAEEQKRKAEEIQKRKEIDDKRRKEEERKIKEEAERKRREKEQKRLEEEEQKRKEEEDRVQQEEEEQKRLEGEKQKHKEEEAKKIRKEKEDQKSIEEEVQKFIEKEAQMEKETEKTDTSWQKVVKATELIKETKDIEVGEDDKELSQAISSLTLVRGISAEIARTLYKADISSIMGLSLSVPGELATKTGIDVSIIKNLIGNAKDLLGLD